MPGGKVPEKGEIFKNPNLANTFEALARHGAKWFYTGEPGQQLVRDCQQHGGLISASDMQSYEVIVRKPVTIESHGARVSVNSPPSPGGCLTVFALSLLNDTQPGEREWGGPQHAMTLASVMRAAGLVRKHHGLAAGLDDQTAAKILSEENLLEWRKTLQSGGLATRGTTHISVADAEGNLASLTLSNGEGSAYVLPGSGVMLNNMLGEEDLSPGGFHSIPAGVRLASMMTPTIANLPDGSQIALGSGGSNRIRSAILQVLINLLDFGMGLEEAVEAPRLHLENDHLNIENGFSAAALAALEAAWPGVEQWPGTNLFFGGVHAVERLASGEFLAAGDHRRGGAVAIAG